MRSPSDAEKDLKEKGLGEIEPELLCYIDAYSETVGLPFSDRPDTVRADCGNLVSIGIAIQKLQHKIGKKSAFLVFDSLTSPYLLNGSVVVRFMNLTLSRFVGKGNSVLACFDEGSGRTEDLVAMMSIANGVLKTEIKESERVLNVVKHPVVKPTRIVVPTDKTWEKKMWDVKLWAPEMMESGTMLMQGKQWTRISRKEVGDFVNLIWPNLSFWNGMLWDPKRLPEKTYELCKESSAYIRKMIPLVPLRKRLPIKLSIPQSFSKVNNMKKLVKILADFFHPTIGTMEYLEDFSKTDEHYVRIYELFECWAFKNVGASMASFSPPNIAGLCEGLEKERREWNAIETKCLGLGDPYCEIRLVPEEIDELRGSLEKNMPVLERINKQLMSYLMGFLLDGKPLIDRPRLGSDVNINGVAALTGIPAMGGERYRMSWRMGGVKIGRKVGERLMNADMRADEALKRLLHLLEECKVGKVAIDKTIKMKESCESIWTKFYTTKWEEPCCFFTTGFFNGFFSAVTNQHVRETKCLALGDPYCEWELIGNASKN
jgi:predicted hydrocarbon binding protein